MNKLNLMVLGAMVCCGAKLSAMDNPGQEFAQQLALKFPNFVTINAAALKEAIDLVPAQVTPWGCGKHQCGHMQACASHGSDIIKMDLDYSTPENYPLAVNVGAELIKSLGVMGAFIPKDSEGTFRVGATPHEIATYLNECVLPISFAYEAETYSKDKLSAGTLVNLIMDSVEKNMPILAYYVIDAQKFLMHIYALVGVNYAQDKILVLDTTGKGIDRLKMMDVEEFVKNMNASSIINVVKMIDSMGAYLNLRNRILESGGRAASVEILNEWKPYSLVICLKDRLQNDPNAECAQQ